MVFSSQISWVAIILVAAHIREFKMPTKFRPSEFHLHRDVLAKVRIFGSIQINITVISGRLSIYDIWN